MCGLQLLRSEWAAKQNDRALVSIAIGLSFEGIIRVKLRISHTSREWLKRA